MRLCVNGAARVVKLSVKIASARVPLPVLVAFLVAAQKTVTICLLVRASATEDRRETRSAVPVEVRAFRIEALTSSPIAGPGKQAILVTSLIGVGAVPIAAIVGGVVNPRASVGAVTIHIAGLTFVPFAIPVPVMMATTVAVFVAISIKIPIATATPALRAIISTVAGRTTAATPATRTTAATPATRTTAATPATRTTAATPATRTTAATPATRTAAATPATRTATAAVPAPTALPTLRQNGRRCYRRGQQRSRQNKCAQLVNYGACFHAASLPAVQPSAHETERLPICHAVYATQP
jgi:hypothetical protein